MRNGKRVPCAGFTYVVVLAWVALMGIGLAITGELWRTAAQREREAQLLFIGDEFRRALNAYYDQSPGVRRFPATLSALLRDERYPTTKRHLRRLYVDPMTGKAEWGVVKQPEGGIVAVFSLSTAQPLRTGNFSGVREAYAGRKKYSEWVFRADAGTVPPPVAALNGTATTSGGAPAPASAAGVTRR